MGDYVGQHLGNYRLLRLLGAGGFAEVYLGEHQHLGTQAAIKVLSTKLNDDGIERFREEARTIARLRHSHIVRVLDFGVEGTIPFLVMDYAPGGTLRQCHPKGTRLPLRTIVSYISQLTSALQYAHDHHLIHRDVKPGNMLISENGEILLSDFGIAIVSQSSRYQSTRDVTGTFAYMAPEQIQAHPRPASDQYSLGIVTYEWLTGNLPFQGSMSEILAKQVMAAPPPMSEKLPTIPLVVEKVVLTALAKDPQQRFASVQAFANAFEQASGDARQRPFPGVVPPRRWTPMLPSADSSPSLTLPFDSQTYIKDPWGIRTTQPPEVTSTQIVAPDPVSLPGLLREAAQQPELMVTQEASAKRPRRRAVSRRFVLLGGLGLLLTGGGISWLALAQANSIHSSPFPVSSSTSITRNQSSSTGTPTATFAPRHSPTSTVQPQHSPTISATPTITPVNTPTSPPTTPTSSPSATKTPPKPGPTLLTYGGHSGGVFSVAWSPDGSRIASATNDGTVQVWNASSGNLLLTYTGHAKAVNAVTWSPDGSRIASGSWDYTAQVWNASSGNTLLTYRGNSNAIFGIRWSPDGSRIATAGYDGTAQVWDASNGTQYVLYKGHGRSVASVAWSPDSSRVVSGGYDNTAQVWNATNGTHLTTYSNHSGVVWTVSWSAGGSLIASGSSDSTVQIWNSGVGTQLLSYTGHSNVVRSVSWSPDGSRIVSGSLDHTAQEWNASNGSSLLTYTGHTASVWTVAWSPDGSRIASGSDDQTTKVWSA